jgi:broad specificity phosphatase PhoE
MTAAPRLMLIRHGKTHANAAGLLMGRTDSRLLPESLQQATALGETLALAGPFAVYSSGQPRALTTAHRITHPHGRRPIQDPALRERDFGRYTLTAFADLTRDPAWARVDTHYDARPPGGETLLDVEKRIFARLLHLHETLPPETTLVVVGHSTCWRLVESVLCGRRHDPLDEPIPRPLTVLEHPRDALEVLRDHV